jgi:hypothetical protein
VIGGLIVIEGGDNGHASVGLDVGSFFYGPHSPLHGFRCEGPEAARILVFISSCACSQESFARLTELTRQHGIDVDRALLAAIAAEYGITVVLPRQHT